MEINLKGKTAVITGAQRGIGAGIAEKFAECGADLALIDLNISQNDDVVKKMQKYGIVCRTFNCDVTDAEQVKTVFEQIREEMGRIDILINNAGITSDGLVRKMNIDKFKKVIDVNLCGTFNCSQQAYLHMKADSIAGCIVNLSSVVAFTGNVGQANYSASKAGVAGLTRAMALECARDKIRVNGIAPGFIMTPMTEAIPEEIRNAQIASIPLKRAGFPEDVANAALYLASEMSSFVTGQVIHVNGGILAH